MKIAIVCDWLVTYAGAEKVLEQMLRVFPEADLFALVDFIEPGKRGFIQNKRVATSFIQNLPKAKTKYRNYLPLMPLAIEQLDVTGYDLVISSSHCVAKGIITSPNQVHISYVHSPIRYAWDLQHQYLQEAGLTKGLKGWVARIILHYMRLWDYRTSNNVIILWPIQNLSLSEFGNVTGVKRTLFTRQSILPLLNCTSRKEIFI